MLHNQYLTVVHTNFVRRATEKMIGSQPVTHAHTNKKMHAHVGKYRVGLSLCESVPEFHGTAGLQCTLELHRRATLARAMRPFADMQQSPDVYI